MKTKLKCGLFVIALQGNNPILHPCELYANPVNHIRNPYWVNYNCNKDRPEKSSHGFRFNKGVTQIDYIIAAGVFILVFALVVQFVSNYFSNIGDKTNIRVMTDQARQLLDTAERGPEPANWPYNAQNASLVLMMHLDNSTLDSSQYGNNGTLQGGANCSAAVIGRLDTGCSFDGIDDLIRVNDQANINFTTGNSFTVLVRINPQALATASWTAVSKQNAVSGAGWRMFLNTTSRELMAIVSDGTNSVTLTSYNNVSNSSWSHIAMVVDREGNASSLYLNGIVVNSSANISSVGSVRNGEPLRIGSISDGQYFNGSIDEVLVYNRSLSANEVRNHYAYETLLDKIGLGSSTYEFYIIVNNTLQYARNQTAPVVTIASENVIFNYTDLGYKVNVPSTMIYEEGGPVVPYSISGNTITFSTAITAGTAKYFTVYFDDDSNFAERTSTVTGVDNLTESIGHIQAFPLVQYRKLLLLNNSNYMAVINATGLPRDFNMQLIDTGTSVAIMNFGPSAPPSGNVVAFQRYTLYQNSTGDIKRGRLLIQSW